MCLKNGLTLFVFRGHASQLLQRPLLDLADAFLGDVEHLADLAQRVAFLAAESEAKLKHNLLSWLEVLHEHDTTGD